MYDFRTGKKFIGGKRYVTFYKDEDYPVFAKTGAIIPLAKIDNNINDTSSPKKLEIQIFPGRSNTYKLYEDDGVDREVLFFIKRVRDALPTKPDYQCVDFEDSCAVYEEQKHFIDFATGNSKFMLGARSALFVPAKNIGLIIVDEEQ